MSKQNLLGDVRAEHDLEMLNQAFLETPDYLGMIEANDRILIVGRRGTGKSALTYMLGKYWEKVKTRRVIRVLPEDFETIGLRPILSAFGDRVTLIRAGSRLIWKYGLILQIMEVISKCYKATTDFRNDALASKHLAEWQSKGGTLLTRLRGKLNTRYPKQHEALESMCFL